MRLLRLVLLAGLTLCAFAADVTGKWKARTEGPDGSQMDIVFDFKVDGDKLSGTATGPMGEMPISQGKLDGDNISFTVEAGELKVIHKGTVSGDEMKLNVEMGDQKLEMTALRSGA
jgi:hypothetical protein